MSRICELCGKTYKKGNLVPRGIGRRVTRRTIRRQNPNLRSKKITVDGKTFKAKICASCLKRMKKDAKDAEASN
jgi:ribosomal protein L28